MATGDGRSTRLAAGFVVLVVAGAPLPARAQANKPIDPFFVTDGTVFAVTESSGTVYLGGSFTYVGPPTGNLAKLDAATAAPDLGFPRVEGEVLALAPDGAGGWYVGGTFTRVGGKLRNGVAHILADGRVSTWNPNAGSGHVTALAVVGRTVYAGGSFTNIGAQARANIAALDAATGLATSWNPGANGQVQVLVVSGSTLYAGGFFTNIGGSVRNRIAALDRTLDTSNATSWNPDANNAVLAIALSGGTVYVGGLFTNIGGMSRSGIAALDAGVDTNNATPWNPSASGLGIVSTLAVSGNVVYAGGTFSGIGGQPRSNIAALSTTSDTNNATMWNPNADNSVQTLALSGGNVYAGGSFTSIGGQARLKLAALDPAMDTNNATSWNPGADGGVNVIDVAGSFVFAGGAFSSSGGKPRNRAAALNSASGSLLAWDPDADNTVRTLAVSPTRVFAGGLFTNIGGQPRDRIAALDPGTGSAIAGWNAGVVDAGVLALDVAGGTVFAGGSFGTVGGSSRLNLAAFSESSGALQSWNPTPSITSFVRAVKVSGSTVYAGGSFDYSLGRKNIVALGASTAAPSNWAPDASGTVGGLALSGTIVYAGGLFTMIGGAARNRIAALDALTDTNNATTWDPDAGADVNAIVPLGSSVLAGGSFITMDSPPVTRKRLAALDATTAAVRPWNPDVADGAVEAMAVGAGRVFAGGSFTAIGGQARLGLAAFCLAAAPTGLIATAGGANRIDLTWTGTGAPLYNVYRSRFAGGPYQMVGSAGVTAFSDLFADATIVYFYVVRAVDQCESDPSNEDSTSTPTGSCNLPPDFDGVAWAEQVTSPTCSVQVGWAPASAPCGGGSVIYSVYRDTSPAFTPAPGNRVGTTGNTSYADTAALSPGTTYYYIVRATSVSNGQEDTNLIQHAAAPAACTQGGPDIVQFFTVSARHQENVLEWRYPPGPGPVTVKVHRTAAPPPCPLFATDGTTLIGSKSGTGNQFDTFIDGPSALPPRPALSNGTTYCYTIWVEKSPNTFSAGQSNKGRPFDTTCATCAAKWAYSLGIASLPPPGLGTEAGNAIHVVANDNTLRAIAKGVSGGNRPSGFLPPTVTGPSQGRPTTILVTVAAGGGSNKVIFLGSQGGVVYAINPDTGATLWSQAVSPALVQAGISGIFRRFPPGDFDYVFAATRVAGADNRLHALHKDDGSPVVGGSWPFDGGAGGPIGIISGQPLVDYVNKRVYFTSYERNLVPAGDENTAWCVNIADASPCWVGTRRHGNIATSLTMRGNRVYVGTNDGKVIALNATTGAFAWEYDSGTALPVRDFVFPDRLGQDLYFSTADSVIAITEALDQGSAALNWRNDYPANTAPSTPIFLSGSTFLYHGDANGRLHRLSTAGGSETGPFPVVLGDGNATVGAPTIDVRQNFLYVGTDAGIIYAVQLP